MKEAREGGMRKRGQSRHTLQRISSRINICGGGCGRRLPTRRKGRFPPDPGNGTNNERDVPGQMGRIHPRTNRGNMISYAKIFGLWRKDKKNLLTENATSFIAIKQEFPQIILREQLVCKMMVCKMMQEDDKNLILRRYICVCKI